MYDLKTDMIGHLYLEFDISYSTDIEKPNQISAAFMSGMCMET